MADVREVEPGKFNTLVAEALKSNPNYKKPEWVDFVKTGSNKMRPNIDPDFWYKRAASILRQLYIYKLVGVGKLISRYGSRKKRGMEPAIFRKSGGKIIRVLLQQSEAAGFVEKFKAKKAGRQLTQKGREFLESFVK